MEMAPLIPRSRLKLGGQLENIFKAISFLHCFIFWTGSFGGKYNVLGCRLLALLSLLQYFQGLIFNIFNLNMVSNQWFRLILN